MRAPPAEVTLGSLGSGREGGAVWFCPRHHAAVGAAEDTTNYGSLRRGPRLPRQPRGAGQVQLALLDLQRFPGNKAQTEVRSGGHLAGLGAEAWGPQPGEHCPRTSAPGAPRGLVRFAGFAHKPLGCP